MNSNLDITEKKNVAFLSVVASGALTLFKIVIGLLTGSLGILSEALHSTLDMVAAIITYFSVKISDKPADNDHNYGHGKVENLSAFAEAILLAITSIWIIYESITKLILNDFNVQITVWSYVVIISSIIIDINRSRMLKKVAKKYNSQALEADSIHFKTDIWSSCVVLVGLILVNFHIYWADSIAALGVASIIILVSYRLAKNAIDVLLDKAPEGVREIIIEILDSKEEVKLYHDLKVRSSGADTFIKFDLHLNSELTLLEAHSLCDKIENEIKEKITRSEIYIHIEPND